MAKHNSADLEVSLPWAGKQVETTEVEEQLSRLWRLAADNVRIGQNMNVRTSVLNFVICAPDAETARQASALIRDLSSTHIARLTLLIFDTRLPSAVSTWVTLRSFPIISDLMRHHFEQITVMTTGSAAYASADIIQRFLKPDLPVYLWWLNDPAESVIFSRLAGISSRVIVDSNSFFAPQQGIESLLALLQDLPGTALSDLNWGRITPWRNLVAQFFDSQEYIPYLGGVNRIEIEHAVAPLAGHIRTEQGDISPNPTRALLFAGQSELAPCGRSPLQAARSHDRLLYLAVDTHYRAVNGKRGHVRRDVWRPHRQARLQRGGDAHDSPARTAQFTPRHTLLPAPDQRSQYYARHLYNQPRRGRRSCAHLR